VPERRGALDPMTALLQMLANVSMQDSCNMTVKVFDGKRRFDITGMDAGYESIDSNSYGMFKGKARACDAAFKMIAGEWKDRKPTRFWQKSETEAGRAPFHIWLARVAPELPELPVRLETGSVYGLVVINLAKWRYAAPEEFKTGAP